MDTTLMSFQELSRVAGGRLFSGGEKQEGRPCPPGFSSVSIDSRHAAPGGLFVALRGSALDGHRFVQAAFDAGAAGALVDFAALDDRELALSGLAESRGCVLVAVPDTLKAFQAAARAYLEKFPGLLRIGITGSSGKTTTKEIAAAIIGREKKVVTNQGNLNSETGLPLAVFTVRACHEVGVFEAAMDHPGEMADLAKVLNPHIALITNIGSAHIGILGSRDAIAEEKKRLFSEFTGDNTAFIPEEDEYRDFLAKDVRGRKIFYGACTLSGLKGVRDAGLEGTEIDWEGEKTLFGLPGKFNLANVFAACAIAVELKMSPASIRQGIASVKPLFGRGEILHGRSVVIRDCYNSNPESAAAAVDFCDSVQWKGRKVYVLGSMLELGELSDSSHAALGEQLAGCRADMVFLFGEEAQIAAQAMEAASKKGPCVPFFYTKDRDELSRALDEYLGPGGKDKDLVLLKGSRGCQMETLTGVLVKEGGA
ncbi:MAG: UDP-N-acetylmuramoyl-tripeptide--D-alanyl-D-alanine ligase [Treponema sp.]|nr:UDP-N-acetylmuramoyl-tripeptide--D-alanyl-D-alanine ligase [Treponema sp.]